MLRTVILVFVGPMKDQSGPTRRPDELQNALAGFPSTRGIDAIGRPQRQSLVAETELRDRSAGEKLGASAAARAVWRVAELSSSANI